MSLRLVDIWRLRKPYYHTAIDDLESFLWLTLWCIYCMIEDKGQLDEQDANALEVLRSTVINTHTYARKGLLYGLDDEETPHPLLALFRPLLVRWGHISREAAKEINKLLKYTTSPQNNVLRDLTHRYFREYLTEGFSHLANFPQSWEACFLPPKNDLPDGLSAPEQDDRDRREDEDKREELEAANEGGAGTGSTSGPPEDHYE